jgi:hypothetical protein
MNMIRNFLFSTVCVMLGARAFAQDTADTNKYDDGRKPHQDMFYVNLTWDYLNGLPGGVSQKWYGRGIDLGLLYDYPFTKSGSISGAVGAGFASHNYYLNALAVTNVSGDTSTATFLVPDDTLVSRSKLSLNYVDIPFELRFRLPKNEKGFGWKFAVGGRVGYLINAHEKIVSPQDIKIKTYHYPHITQWRYGVTARAGYGSVMLSAFYSLSPLFEPANSLSDQHALTVGLTIVPF